MSNLILLLVAAAWAAVLVPPLVRSRLRNSPTTSVSNFRRQLSSLQRDTRPLPQGGRHLAPLRDAARPFAPAARVMGRPLRQVGHATSSMVRPRGARQHARFEGEYFERELVRRRRANWLFGLLGTAGVSLLLAIAMREMFFVWTFTLASLALGAYSYMLVQWRVRRDHERYRRQFRRVA
ncbi:MAG: hypothetical protein RL072_185 [Actinomycetota bacterium]|jgi:hypothetical protein